MITENIIVRKRIKIGAITKKSQHPKGDQDQSDYEEHDAIMVKKKTKTKAIMKSFTINVATPLWAKCEDETHTPESGNLESSGTPENLELDCKGQNILHWSVLYTIGKIL